jgi:hypothetical protein
MSVTGPNLEDVGRPSTAQGISAALRKLARPGDSLMGR